MSSAVFIDRVWSIHQQIQHEVLDEYFNDSEVTTVQRIVPPHGVSASTYFQSKILPRAKKKKNAHSAHGNAGNTANQVVVKSAKAPTSVPEFIIFRNKSQVVHKVPPPTTFKAAGKATKHPERKAAPPTVPSQPAAPKRARKNNQVAQASLSSKNARVSKRPTSLKKQPPVNIYSSTSDPETKPEAGQRRSTRLNKKAL